jgi:hypothetical protein
MRRRLPSPCAARSRAPEADRLLALADRFVRAAHQRGPVPASFEANSARVWAAQGRTVEALAALQRAMASGWRHWETAILPRLADDPGFRNLRGDPRFRRLDAMLQAELARERRELRSGGL